MPTSDRVDRTPLGLALEVQRLKVTLHGDRDDPGAGLVARVRALEDGNSKMIRRLNLWGGILLGVISAKGLLDGDITKVVHAVLAGLGGG